MGKLTAAKVRVITRTGLHGDGGTLYLNVAPGGAKVVDSKTHGERPTPRYWAGRVPDRELGGGAGKGI